MIKSDLFGCVLSSIFVVLITVLFLQGCKEVERTKINRVADLRELYEGCAIFTVEEQRFVVCRGSSGVAITPLDTQCSLK